MLYGPLFNKAARNIHAPTLVGPFKEKLSLSLSFSLAQSGGDAAIRPSQRSATAQLISAASNLMAAVEWPGEIKEMK